MLYHFHVFPHHPPSPLRPPFAFTALCSVLSCFSTPLLLHFVPPVLLPALPLSRTFFPSPLAHFFGPASLLHLPLAVLSGLCRPFSLILFLSYFPLVILSRWRFALPLSVPFALPYTYPFASSSFFSQFLCLFLAFFFLMPLPSSPPCSILTSFASASAPFFDLVLGQTGEQ